jgi:hypothetical protein
MANESSANTAFTATTSSKELRPQVIGQVRRTQLIITNIGAGTLTVTKGDVPAVANNGIILSQNQAYIESDDGGFRCWQGSIQCVASGSLNVTVVETFETP